MSPRSGCSRSSPPFTNPTARTPCRRRAEINRSAVGTRCMSGGKGPCAGRASTVTASSVAPLAALASPPTRTAAHRIRRIAVSSPTEGSVKGRGALGLGDGHARPSGDAAAHAGPRPPGPEILPALREANETDDRVGQEGRVDQRERGVQGSPVPELDHHPDAPVREQGVLGDQVSSRNRGAPLDLGGPSKRALLSGPDLAEGGQDPR